MFHWHLTQKNVFWTPDGAAPEATATALAFPDGRLSLGVMLRDLAEAAVGVAARTIASASAGPAQGSGCCKKPPFPRAAGVSGAEGDCARTALSPASMSACLPRDIH